MSGKALSAKIENRSLLPGIKGLTSAVSCWRPSGVDMLVRSATREMAASSLGAMIRATR